MTQTQQVIETMRKLGGYATFGKLNQTVNFFDWETKTPEASVRRIVQNSPDIFRIRPGLWALKEFESEVLKKFKLDSTNAETEVEFTHSYYQGLAVEMGNLGNMNTYIPNQDKNRLFLGKPLREVASLQNIYQFSYSGLVGYAKTVDVIWFNDREMPHAFYEIEHTTDIQNSLVKFYELQDFFAEFFIVADNYRRGKFQEVLSKSIFKPIKERVKFMSYDMLSDRHTLACRQADLGAL